MEETAVEVEIEEMAKIEKKIEKSIKEKAIEEAVMIELEIEIELVMQQQQVTTKEKGEIRTREIKTFVIEA